MDKVSIIVPVYNSETYISECIDSLLNQTYKNIEILIINDGSTDSSYSICQEYEAKDERVFLYNIENSGVSTARNIGIENSTGNYITFVDSDDWTEPTMIDFAVKKAKTDNVDIVIWSYFKNFKDMEIPLPLITDNDHFFKEDKNLLYLKSIDSMYNQEKSMQSVSAGTTWCKLYKREIITKNELKFNPILTRAQDTIFSINAFNKAKNISYYNEHLYHYRITNTSTSSGTRFISNTMKPFNELLKEFFTFSDKVKKDKDLVNVLNIRTVKVLLWHLEHNYFHENFSGNLLARKKSVNNLLKTEPFKTSLKNVQTEELPKKEKMMVRLFRKKLILCFYVVYKILDKRNESRRFT